MDSLIEIDRKDWPALRDLYRIDWPKNAVAFCLLDTQISYPDFSETFSLKMFSPDGDIHNGIVAVSCEGGYYQMKIHPLNDIKKMEDALASTKLIDWNKFVLVGLASLEVEDCIIRLSNRLGLIVRDEIACKYLLNRDSALLEEISTPDDTYISEPKVEHLKIIDETWSFHGSNTYKLFETLLRNHRIFVLYSKEDNPLAWLSIDDSGALTHLYCVEEHRRKGYAEYILRFVVNNELKNGKDLIAFTREDNIKPKKLFDKFNFEKMGYDKWLAINKI